MHMTKAYSIHTLFDTLIEEVHIQLNNFSTWFITNKLSLLWLVILEKTNFIIFTPNWKKYNIKCFNHTRQKN